MYALIIITEARMSWTSFCFFLFASLSRRCQHGQVFLFFQFPYPSVEVWLAFSSPFCQGGWVVFCCRVMTHVRICLNTLRHSSSTITSSPTFPLSRSSSLVNSLCPFLLPSLRDSLPNVTTTTTCTAAAAAVCVVAPALSSHRTRPCCFVQIPRLFVWWCDQRRLHRVVVIGYVCVCVCMNSMCYVYVCMCVCMFASLTAKRHLNCLLHVYLNVARFPFCFFLFFFFSFFSVVVRWTDFRCCMYSRL